MKSGEMHLVFMPCIANNDELESFDNINKTSGL
jgi:hypothetical protein